MGTMDSTYYRLTCKGCGAVDEPVARERGGGGYSAGSWSVPESEVFSLSLENSYGEEIIRSASCPCGGEVEVRITRTGA